MQNCSPMISSVYKACQRASYSIMRDFGELEKLQISKKGISDFVTIADLRTEKLLTEELMKIKPGCSFLLEESGEINVSNLESKSGISYRWIVDPIDGTVNFMHGNPNFCISVALEKRTSSLDGEIFLGSEIVVGLIYCPLLRESYWAEKGKGAYYVNYLGHQSRMRVNARSNFMAALCAISGVRQLNAEDVQPLLSRLYDNNVKIRISGSVALDLAYVASGRFDMALCSRLKPWDIAAGVLMVKEAGGVISNIVGSSILEENASIIAANEVLCAKLLA